MTPIEQLEAEVAKEEATLAAELERAQGLWREVSTRLKALRARLEQAQASGADVKAVAPRIAALELPHLHKGPASQRAEGLRHEAAAARRAASAELRRSIPEFTAALARAQHKVAAEEGAVTQQVELAKAVAHQVSEAARQLEAAGDEPLPIGNQKPRRTDPRVRMQVKIDFTSDNNFYSGFSTNLSDGGVFIATVKLVPIGTHVDLFFRLPNGDGIEAQGVVRWVREIDDRSPENMPGLGVQFLNLADAAKVAIGAFVREREPMFFPD
ncbi:MAG: TIGR02266 family protein [Archangiaceae bacterium]|nr:TIGR02266 family protein [Archangiaceae bacterium]